MHYGFEGLSIGFLKTKKIGNTDNHTVLNANRT